MVEIDRQSKRKRKAALLQLVMEMVVQKVHDKNRHPERCNKNKHNRIILVVVVVVCQVGEDALRQKSKAKEVGSVPQKWY